MLLIYRKLLEEEEKNYQKSLERKERTLEEISIQTIKETLLELSTAFPVNELADFSLKMKNEGLIRNKFKELWTQRMPNKIVYPEYKRIDLAVLDGSWNLQSAIEFKSFFSIDAYNDNPEYFPINPSDSLLVKDLHKNTSEQGIDNYLVVCVTHPHKAMFRELKYPTLKKDREIYDNHVQLLHKLNMHMDRLFSDSRYEIERCSINAGSAFEIEVSLYFWIVKKIG